MNEGERIESRIQLLVEGNDHRNFFRAFIRQLAMKDIQIRSFGGINDLGRFLRAFVSAPGFGDSVQRIGIVRDAEVSAASAFQSVQSSLDRAGLSVPDRPEQVSSGDPAVCVLILPGSGREGMLETLLCETFAGSADDRCISEFFECVAEAGEGNIRWPAKARAWAYLATRAEPHHSVGYATEKGYWGDLDQPAFRVVREFLRKLDIK